MFILEKFTHTDVKTNPGHVIAARSGGKYPPNTSIKILVHHAHSDEPITFTSDGKLNLILLDIRLIHIILVISNREGK